MAVWGPKKQYCSEPDIDIPAAPPACQRRYRNTGWRLGSEAEHKCIGAFASLISTYCDALISTHTLIISPALINKHTVLRGTTRHLIKNKKRTTRYYTRYYGVLRGTTRYYEVLRGTTAYYEVLRGTTKYYTAYYEVL